MRTAPLVLPACLLALTACGGSSTTPAAAGGSVAVRASDDACELDRTTLSPGRNTFAITNRGTSVTEVYLYADGDRVVAEKENIGPGLSVELSAKLAAGSYEVACKPGMTGNGIRTAITVADDSGSSADPS